MTHLYFECRGVGTPVAMCVRAKDAARGREFVLTKRMGAHELARMLNEPAAA